MWSRPARLPLLVVALLAAAAPVRAAEPARRPLPRRGRRHEGLRVRPRLRSSRGGRGEGRRDGASWRFSATTSTPRGCRPAGDPARGEMESRLDAQLTAARAAGRVVVVPGNHDWGHWKKDGWAAIRREEDFVDERGGPNVTFAPSGGCPGPGRLRPRRRGPADRPGHPLVAPRIREARRARPRPAPRRARTTSSRRSGKRFVPAGGPRTVVLAHHPIESGGRSGSHFGWRDHLFPLTHLRSWFWLPLPVIGTLGVGGRIALRVAAADGLADVPPLEGGDGARLRSRAPVRLGRRPRPQSAGDPPSGPRHELEPDQRRRGRAGSVTPADPIDGTLFAKERPGLHAPRVREGRARPADGGRRPARPESPRFSSPPT